MKVKISSFTPLFFPYTAQHVSQFSETTFIQGLYPTKFALQILKSIDFIFRTNFSKKIQKRIPKNFCGKNIGIGIPEILMIIGLKMKKKKSGIQSSAHILYGWLSKKYLSDADIFHVRSGSGRGGAIQEAKKNNIVVITDHSIAHPKTMESILLDEYEKYQIPFEFSNCFWDQVLQDCEEADYLLVNSDFVKKSFLTNGYDPGKIRVIYLGVREDFWGCKKKYDLTEVFNLLFIGEFGFRKGCEYLLKSLSLIKQKGINFKLTVIGPYDSFQSVITNYNTEQVDFKGGVPYDDLKNYYANSDAYIFPSLCEGSTMAGMEAMSAGLPCIFTENCGVPVKHGENGLIIPIKDEHAIADAVELLYRNKLVREKLGANASQTIRDNYKWTDYRNNIESFYNEVISLKTPPDLNKTAE